MTNSDNGSSCNRRLSRAAWKLLQRDLMPVLLQQQGKEPFQTDEYEEEYDISEFWNLLQQDSSLPLKDDNDTTNCILQDPSKFMFYKDELESISLSATTTATNNHNSNRNKYRKQYSYFYSNMHNTNVPPQYYKCGMCGKMFTSPYYLDQHFDTQHHNDNHDGDATATLDNNNHDHHHYHDDGGNKNHKLNNNNNNDDDNNDYCPATILCHTLLGGIGRCQQMALELEPYYDVGSNGYHALDASIVRTKWSRIAHAWHCNDIEMAHAQERCYTMMNTCFGDGTTNNEQDEQSQKQDNNNNKDMGSSSSSTAAAAAAAVCDQLTCHSVLDQLLAMEGGNQHPTSTSILLQQLRQNIHEWNMHHNYTIGFWGCLSLAVLSMYYMVYLGLVWKKRKGRYLFTSKRGNHALFRRRPRSQQQQSFSFGKYLGKGPTPQQYPRNEQSSSSKDEENEQQRTTTSTSRTSSRNNQRQQLVMGILRQRHSGRPS